MPDNPKLLIQTAFQIDKAKADLDAKVRQIQSDAKIKFKIDFDDKTVNQAIKQQTNSYTSFWKQALKERELAELSLQKTSQQREKSGLQYWQSRFKDSVSSLTSQSSELKKMSKYYSDLEKQTQKAAKAQQQMANLGLDKNKLSSSMDAWIAQNQKAIPKFGKQIENLKGQLQSADKVELGNISKQFQTLTKDAQSFGVAGRTTLGEFANNVGKMATWALGGTAIFGTWNAMKDMVSTVTQLDTAMVELRKVTEETEATYQKFYLRSNDIAKSVGATTKTIIEETAAWAQMGYSLKDAEKLAENSAIFTNISEGMSMENATASMISMMKAYGIEAENSLDGIIDKVNILGNRFAVTNADVAEGMRLAGSAMADANNTFEQTAALITAGAEITRDASEMGTALKTVSMRLRGLSEETGDADESLKDVAKTVKSLSGISIFTDSTQQTYKSTYQILKEISEVYDSLTDRNQAKLLELTSGKHQGNRISAILQNFSTAESAIKAQGEASGTAMREQETYMDSIVAKMNEFKETFVGISQQVVDSDFVKGTVETGTGFLGAISWLIENLGTIPTLATAAGAALSGIKNVGKENSVCEYALPFQEAA